jgi:hypothetical protein
LIDLAQSRNQQLLIEPHQRKNNMNARLTIGIIGSTLLTFLTPAVLNAQSNVYGTSRIPRQTCPPQSKPTSGAISAAQAAVYAACSAEAKRTGYSAQFIDIGKMRIVKSRSANIQDIQQFPGIDTEKPVYELSASVVFYDCFRVSDLHPAGQNCTVHRIPENIGKCLKLTSGNWNCAVGTYALNSERKQPAPTK